MIQQVLVFLLVTGAASLNKKDGEKCLSAHNKLRALHDNTVDLQWDDDLAKSAQRHAASLAKYGLKHVDDKIVNLYGENIYVAIANEDVSCAEAVLNWYNEIHDWDFRTNAAQSISAETRQFTQLVWAGARKVGVGLARADRYGKRETYVVARYSPRGNVDGEYAANVHLRKDGAITPTLQDLDGNAVTEMKCENIFDKCGDLFNFFAKPCDQDQIRAMCKKDCKEC